MTPKLISADAIIATVTLQFNLQGTSWIPKAYEWIGKALQGIGGLTQYQRVRFETRSKNHRVPFPCNLVHLKDIEYQGRPLHLSLDSRHMTFGLSGGLPNNEDNKYGMEYPTLIDDIEQDITVAGSYDVKNVNTSVHGAYYYLNNNTIYTSFAEDDLVLHYDGIALDERGLPLVPDSFEHDQALAFFILYMYLSSGNTHPTWKIMDAYQMWEKYRPQAFGRAMMPTKAELHAFTNSWARIVHDHFVDDKFGFDAGNKQTVFNI